jgi:hypothetical protein
MVKGFPFSISFGPLRVPHNFLSNGHTKYFPLGVEWPGLEGDFSPTIAKVRIT